MISERVGSCPACLTGSLFRKSFQRDVDHRGTKDSIAQLHNVCDHCGIELFDDKCGKHNRRQLIAFQKRVEGVPTGAQIRAIRERLGLTSEAAGRLLGGGPKAFSKYEHDEIVPKGAMRTLLTLLTRYPEVIDKVKASKSIELHPIPAGAVKVTNLRGFPAAPAWTAIVGAGALGVQALGRSNVVTERFVIALGDTRAYGTAFELAGVGQASPSMEDLLLMPWTTSAQSAVEAIPVDLVEAPRLVAAPGSGRRAAQRI